MNTLSPQAEWVGSAFEKFVKVLKEADARRVERHKRQGTEDFDAEELEALEEENQAEEELFDQVGVGEGRVKGVLGGGGGGPEPG